MPTFHEIGTITFDGFDDGDREIRRPKFGQIRWFQRSIRNIAQTQADEVAQLQDEMDKAVEAGDNEVAAALTRRARDLNDFGIVDSFIPWYRELFEQLSKPLPEDVDDWPGYFIDPKLPSEIVNHWKMNPKASGDTTPT